MFKKRKISTSIDEKNVKHILFFENKFNLIFILSVAPIFLWLYFAYTATILSKTYFFSNVREAFEKYEVKGSYFEPFGGVSIILGLIYLVFVLLLINMLKNRQRKIEVTHEDIKVYKEYDRLSLGLVFFLISALPWFLPYIWYGLFIISIQGYNYDYTLESTIIFAGLILLLFYFVIKLIFHFTRNKYIKQTKKTYSRSQIDGYIIKKP
ncbi:MAG: hypothetical protein GVY19_00005, partial [Bacteroidetes bacterium]|nr:hypothetical protein [Bacteroidota bacterium]